MKVRSSFWTFGVVILSLLMVMALGCSDDKSSPTAPAATEFQVLQGAVDAYTGGTQAPVLNAQDLFDNINDGNSANDYVVVSVRSADHYAVGHIPGAINIPWREIAKDVPLAKLSKNSKLAVYCYTGHTGGIATTLLNVMGFEAYNLKFGMGSWTKDQTVRVAAAFNEVADANDFTVETQANPFTETFDLPHIEYAASNLEAVILQAASDFVATDIAGAISANDVFDNLNDGNAGNDPIVLSVRSAEHYAIGHIPGAFNIPWREIGKEENLRKLDPAKQIVVYCYTGHTGAVAATALKLLGYDAVNMKFGVMSWTKDPSVRVASAFDESTDANDFPYKTGSAP